MSDWQLALVLWLAFNASLILFAWLCFRPEEADGPEPRPEWLDVALWDAELAHAAAMRRHPAGGRRDLL